MEKIISKIGIDKFMHICVSMIMMLELRRFLPNWQAALIVLFVGVLKEVYDKVSGKGTAEWKDIAADCVGIIFGCV